MFADIRVLINHQPEVVVAPSEAILEDNGNMMVFVVEDSKFIPRIIQTGTQQNGDVEVISGLKEGDTLVIQGNFQLKSKLYDDHLKKAHVH